MKNLSIVNADNNITFNIVIVEKGEAYGLNNCLIAENTLVEFYDSRYNHSEYGQFVARYNLDTIKNYNTFYGLRLNTGSENWYVTHYNIQVIKEFIKDID